MTWSTMNAASVIRFRYDSLFIILFARISLYFVQLRFLVVLLLVFFAFSVETHGLVIGEFRLSVFLLVVDLFPAMKEKRGGEDQEISRKSRDLSLTM